MDIAAIDANRLMWLAAGAGSKGLVSGMISGMVPQAGITPDIISAGVGLFLSNQGGERMGPFGEGMLIASIGNMVRQPIESLLGGIVKPPAAQGGLTAEQQALLAQQQYLLTQGKTQGNGGDGALDTYSLAKYGV